jgi:glycosyltransferase involved in cell wall biosynthesis
MKKVSVIIPTYNKCKFLDLTLAGFLLQSYENFELIIIDDGSSDMTREVVRKYESKLDIRYIYKNNGGRSSARNYALKMDLGEYIIFNDDDRIPSPDLIKYHMDKLEKNNKLVTIGYKHEILSFFIEGMRFDVINILNIANRNPSIIRKIVLDNEDQLFTSEELINNYHKTISDWYLRESIDNYGDVYQKYTDDLIGFDFGWVLATTASLGFKFDGTTNIFFDEAYKGWGVEDTDFSYQLYKQGYTFGLVRKAETYHQFHKKEKGYKVSVKRNLKYFSSKYPFIEIYLFSMIFEDDFTLIKANEILNELKNGNSLIYDEYVKLCRLFTFKE